MAVKLAIETVFTALDHITNPMKAMAENSKRYAHDAEKAGQGIARVWSGLKATIGAAVIGLTTGAAAKAITDFADKGDEISRMASILGVTTTAWQKMSYAAKMSDMTTEDLTGVYKKMNNSLGQLKAGQGTLLANLKFTNPQLALQLRHTKSSETAFGLLMDAIAAETDTTKRAALTQAAFGRGGQDIIEMALHYRDLAKEAQDSGGIISQEDLKSGQELHETLKKVGVRLQGFLNIVLGAGVRALGPWLDKMEKWLAANRQLIGQKIEDTIKWIANAVKTAYDIFTKWWPVIRDVGAAFIILNLALKGFAVASAISKGISIASAALELFTKGARMATVAQIALNMAQKEGMLGGAGGKMVQGAISLAAGGGLAGAAGMAAAVVGPAAFLGAMYYGASQYAKNPTAENLNPNNALLNPEAKARMAATPVSPYMAGIMTPALAGALNAQKSTLDITLNGFPTGTSVKAASGGSPAITVNQFNTLRGL